MTEDGLARIMLKMLAVTEKVSSLVVADTISPSVTSKMGAVLNPENKFSLEFIMNIYTNRAENMVLDEYKSCSIYAASQDPEETIYQFMRFFFKRLKPEFHVKAVDTLKKAGYERYLPAEAIASWESDISF